MLQYSVNHVISLISICAITVVKNLVQTDLMCVSQNENIVSGVCTLLCYYKVTSVPHKIDVLVHDSHANKLLIGVKLAG